MVLFSFFARSPEEFKKLKSPSTHAYRDALCHDKWVWRKSIKCKKNKTKKQNKTNKQSSADDKQMDVGQILEPSAQGSRPYTGAISPG